jgi:hypothetical protein
MNAIFLLHLADTAALLFLAGFSLWRVLVTYLRLLHDRSRAYRLKVLNEKGVFDPYGASSYVGRWAFVAFIAVDI